MSEGGREGGREKERGNDWVRDTAAMHACKYAPLLDLKLYRRAQGYSGNLNVETLKLNSTPTAACLQQPPRLLHALAVVFRQGILAGAEAILTHTPISQDLFLHLYGRRL